MALPPVSKSLFTLLAKIRSLANPDCILIDFWAKIQMKSFFFLDQIQTTFEGGLKYDSNPICTDASSVWTMCLFKSDIRVSFASRFYMEIGRLNGVSWRTLQGARQPQSLTTSCGTFENLYATSHHQVSQGQHALSSHYLGMALNLKQRNVHQSLLSPSVSGAVEEFRTFTWRRKVWIVRWFISIF